MNQYQPQPETKTHICFRCKTKYTTDKEGDFNKMRALVLTQDRIEGKRTITIAETTHYAIQELSSQRSGATYDDIILAALDSYKREQEIGPQTDPLENIVNEEE